MTFDMIEERHALIDGGKWSARSIAIALLVAVAIALAGCRNTGTYAVVGDVVSPVDISDGSDTVKVRALFALTGAKVWCARDSKVKMTYTNVYTNSYIGIVDTQGVQNFKVETEPLDVSGTSDSSEPENQPK